MADSANPPSPKTSNAVMTAQGWGTINVRVMRLSHGISIISSGAKSRRGRALYVTRRTSGSFVADLMCASYDEYATLGAWIRGYGERLASSAPSVGPVRMICPSREFDKVAVPTRMTFGDSAGEFTYPVSISFVGARDPVPLTSDYVSSFALPGGSDDPSLPYYYPGGTQLSGNQAGVDSLFDVPPSPLSNITTPEWGGGPVRSY